MKRILYKSFALVLVAAFAITGFTGCTKKYFEETYIEGTESSNYLFDVGMEGNDWLWNETASRYECTFEFKELTDEIYDYGSMYGSVYVEPKLSGEWIELLPYSAVHYYEVEGVQKAFDVTVSCAFQRGEVKFILQLSDRTRQDAILEPYQFKVTLTFDPWNLPN